jgi:glycosyltransferase involved in cell wall biosynthesis
MTQVDLAVDRADFPVLKRSFNPPGKRKFVYIGINFWYKNPKFLSAIAKAMPEAEIAWCGSGKPIDGVRALGRQDFRDPAAKELLSQYDFMLTVGNSDANPTTILEAMSWGLIPVCTPQSGYVRYPSIPNVPLDDVEGAVRVLRGLQSTPEDDLLAMQRENWAMLDDHFNWDRFAEQVRAAIESDSRPGMGPEPLSRKLQLKWANVRAKGFWARPDHLGRSIYWAIKRRPWRVVEFPTPPIAADSPNSLTVSPN